MLEILDADVKLFEKFRQVLDPKELTDDVKKHPWKLIRKPWSIVIRKSKNYIKGTALREHR